MMNKVFVNYTDSDKGIAKSIAESLRSSTVNTPLWDRFVSFETRYKKGALIGEGGSKNVYRMYDNYTQRLVAVGELKNRPSEEKYESFIREACITASLEHPNIVPLYDMGLDDNGPYTIMKLVDKRTLSDVITKARRKRLRSYDLNEVLITFLKICDAISYAHSKGVIHLDLKPENVNIGKHGEVMVCDWGISKIVDVPEGSDSNAMLDPGLYNDFTLDNVIKGSLGFMAPEQFKQSIAEKSMCTDVYQLGGVLYMMLCFRAPIEGESLSEYAKKTLKGVIVPPDVYKHDYFDIPVEISQVCMKALEKKSLDRYQSVQELKEDVVSWLNGFSTSAEASSFTTRAIKAVKRNRVVFFICCMSFIISTYSLIKARDFRGVALEKNREAQEYSQQSQESYKKFREVRAQFEENKGILMEAGDYASPFLIAEGEKHLNRGRFKDAANCFSKARLLSPRDELAIYFTAFEKFCNQDFEGFLKVISQKKHITEDTKVLMALARKYSPIKGYADRLRFSELKALLNEIPFSRPYYLLALSHYQSYPPNEEKYEFIQMTLQKTNPQILNWDYSIDDHESSHSFDFSKTPDIADFSALRGIPIDRLNIDNSNLRDSKELSFLLVDSISMLNTHIGAFEVILTIPTLNTLIIDRDAHPSWDFSKYPNVNVIRK